MLKSLCRFGTATLYSASLFHFFAIVLVIAEAFTDSVIDRVIYIVLYPAYGDVSETSVPYLIACLLPTKPVRRFIIIIYIPVICLWRAGRKTQRRRPSSCENFDPLVEGECGLMPPLQPLVEGDCGLIPPLQLNRSQRKKQVYLYRPKRFLCRVERRLEKGWRCCSRQCARPFVWVARHQILLAVHYGRRLWGFCYLVLVTGPVAVCRNAVKWFNGDVESVELDGQQLKGRSLWEFPKQPRSSSLLLRSRRSLSWGELVHLKDERYQTILKSYSKRLTFYRLLPLKTASRLWGRINQLQLPVWLRTPAFRLYISTFGCCLEDALVQDLTKYRNLSEFFQRSLRPGIRPIDGTTPLVSPVDGTVLYFGAVKNGALEQVKGVTYSMKGFLGPMDELLSSCINIATTKTKPVNFSIEGDLEMKDVSADDFLCTLNADDLSYHQNILTNASNQLFQCIIYLAPGDYHRFHSPADWTVFGRRHFPGELFSVKPGFARWLQGLFNFNERALYVGRWQNGFFSMTAVGATNVGSISVGFDKTLSTNRQSAWETGCFFDAVFLSKKCNGVKLRKGDDFGAFNLGSTVVLLFEAPPTFEFQIEIGQKLKYGQRVGGCSKTKTANRCRRRT